MEFLHRDLLRLSVQQGPQGRLPKGLVQELGETTELAQKFISSLGAGAARALDHKVYNDPQFFCEDTVRKATQLNLYSLWLPKALGGGGFHPLSMYSFNFEMAAYCLGISNLIGAHYVGLGLVSAANSFSVLKRIIADIRLAEKNGTHCVVSAAITEPGAGSDLEDSELIRKAKVCTRAQKVPGGYLLNGQQIFISNSALAKWHIVSCFEDVNDPAGSVTLLAVPAGSAGVSVGRTEHKLGQSASPASVLFFEDVFVPDENVCFAKSQFTKNEDYLRYADCLLNDVLSLSRAGVGGMGAGVLKRAVEILVQHSETSLHDKKPSDQEWVQAQIGRVVQNFVVAKTLSWEGYVECYSHGPYQDLQKSSVYSAFKKTPGWLLQNTLGAWMTSSSGQSQLRQQRLARMSARHDKWVAGWGALVKGTCSDLAVDGLLKALDIVGTSGGEAYWELEKILRDSKLLQIYEGTNELNTLMSYKNFVGPAEQTQDIFRE